eukprot:4718320-Amphidinium_carterae.1
MKATKECLGLNGIAESCAIFYSVGTNLAGYKEKQVPFPHASGSPPSLTSPDLTWFDAGQTPRHWYGTSTVLSKLRYRYSMRPETLLKAEALA